MHALRQARFLARLVLAWFALSVGIAVAAPLVQPQAVQFICAGGGGMKLLVTGDDGNAAAGAPTLDCPLCATVAPPPVAAPAAVLPLPLGVAMQPIPAARIAALTAAPPPARGPPGRA